MLLERRLKKRAGKTTDLIMHSREKRSGSANPEQANAMPASGDLMLPALALPLHLSPIGLAPSPISDWTSTPVLTPSDIPQLPSALFTFDDGSIIACTPTTDGDARLPAKLVCATFNVDFDRVARDERADYSLNLLADLAPDIIALQEVTKSFMERARAHILFASLYATTCDTVFGSYCTVLCVKRTLLPCVQRVFEAAPPTDMGRLIPAIIFRGPDGESFSVAGVHLESADASQPLNDKLRASQLRYVGLPADVRGAPLSASAFVMGDTNFSKAGDGHALCEGASPETTAVYEAMLQANWADDDVGGDHTLTPMRPTGHSEGRVDVGLRRGVAYAHTTVRRCASEPIRDGDPPVFASDHLLMLFELS